MGEVLDFSYLFISSKQNEKGRKIRMKDYSRVSKFLEIPREVISDVPKITITGFDEILIENFKGILEYEDFFVRISTSLGNININGFNLKLNQMTDDDILVNGKIENIDLEGKNGG